MNLKHISNIVYWYFKCLLNCNLSCVLPWWSCFNLCLKKGASYVSTYLDQCSSDYQMFNTFSNKLSNLSWVSAFYKLMVNLPIRLWTLTANRPTKYSRIKIDDIFYLWAGYYCKCPYYMEKINEPLYTRRKMAWICCTAVTWLNDRKRSSWWQGGDV